MKKSGFILVLIILSISVFGQNVIFIHHSTGAGVYNGGIGLPQWLDQYNTNNGTGYTISEVSYPDSPYEWANYPYDYWNLLVNRQCNDTEPGIRCLNYFISNYDVIIIKHCFPGAGIEADDGNPLVSSSNKTLANYKLQYSAIRSLMDSFPNNKFIVWTLAPLHRNATDTESAARAREFVNWVKNDWLTEDSKPHPNIFIFDFFSLAAELNSTPANGKLNCLKYDYEGDHDGNDSHPNKTANAAIMPLFGQFIVDVINNNDSNNTTTNVSTKIQENDIRLFPNPAKRYVSIEGVRSVESIEIYNISGTLIIKQITPDSEIDISTLSKGIYLVKFNVKSELKSRLLIIN